MGGPRRAWSVCAVALLLSACDAYDGSALEREGFGAAARALGDAGPSSPCSANAELCNGRDDDCDSKVDERAERSCSFAQGIGVCVDGACLLAGCETDYLDCNKRSSDGCEQSAADMPCGACQQCAPDSGAAPNPAGANSSAAGRSGGPDRDDDDDDDDDAGACNPEPERCDERDNDCDGQIDEDSVCAVAACVATQPSYRGAACDQCVCERCATQLGLCQSHTDTAYRELCRDLVECFVVNDCAGACGDNEDCYRSGNGPCAAEVNLAAGGSGPMDRSQVNGGACSVSSPPRSACGAATVYREQCIETVCDQACGD